MNATTLRTINFGNGLLDFSMHKNRLNDMKERDHATILFDFNLID